MQLFEQLEVRWAEWNGLDPDGMVACSSGTAALHLAFQAAGLDRGKQVVMSDYTMVACPVAVALAGLVPKFVDCDGRLLFPQEYRDARDKGTEAVLAVHVYGRKCNMNAIVDGAEPRGLYVVEDIAEAHGVKPHPKTDAACWSFYKNKIVAGEEGGAVWFRNKGIAKHARSLRSLGFTNAHDYTHIPFGHNYRMSNIHAELVLRSLNDYTDNLCKRWEQWDAYGRCLTRILDISKSREPDQPWVFDVKVPADKQTAIVRALQEAGVAARFGFKPMTSQPQFYETTARIAHPIAYLAGREMIYLPLDPLPVREQIERAGVVYETVTKLIS